jgi:hypothetical protein
MDRQWLLNYAQPIRVDLTLLFGVSARDYYRRFQQGHGPVKRIECVRAGQTGQLAEILRGRNLPSIEQRVKMLAFLCQQRGSLPKRWE